MGGLNMEKKTIFSVLLILAAIIGVGSGYSFDNGNNTMLFACILVGLVVLIAAYYFFEKLGDEKYNDKIGKF